MGKEWKYLLITQSFPHFPQIFPQRFSTGKGGCGYAIVIYIKRYDEMLQNSYFFDSRGFYHSHFFVHNFGA